MKPNMGTLDRVVRLIAGLLLFLAPFLGLPVSWSDTWLAIGSMGVGVVLSMTAFFGYCPLYSLFGLET